MGLLLGSASLELPPLSLLQSYFLPKKHEFWRILMVNENITLIKDAHTYCFSTLFNNVLHRNPFPWENSSKQWVTPRRLSRKSLPDLERTC
jgi:hypothetical protein